MKLTKFVLPLLPIFLLAACERPVVVTTPAPAPAAVVVPGPPGPPGAPGKPGDSTTVIVTPPAPSK